MYGRNNAERISKKNTYFFVFTNETVVIEKFNALSFSPSLSLCNFNITPVFSFTKNLYFSRKMQKVKVTQIWLRANSPIFHRKILKKNLKYEKKKKKIYIS